MPETPAVASPDSPPEREWWDDPSLPWKHKPTRSDIACWTWIAIGGVYGLAMLPLRGWLVTVPYVSALINGGRVSLVAIGALVATRHDPLLWWLPTLLFAALTACKWDWLYWWAGKLWGNALIDTWTAEKPRYQRLAARLEAFARRHTWLALILTYLPIPLVQVVYVVLGASGVRLRRFVAIDYVIALAHATLFFLLGYRIGMPAVDLLTLYSKYAMYVSLALLVVMVIAIWRRSAKQADARRPQPTAYDTVARSGATRAEAPDQD